MKRGVSFYILIALALAALVAMIWALAPGAEPNTPPVILAPLPTADVALGAPLETQDGHIIAVNADTVKTVIATLSRTDSYSRTLTVQSFWNGGNATTRIQIWHQGSRERIRLEPERGPAKNILIRGGEEWIWYDDSASRWHGPTRPGDADAWQTLLPYEDVLALDQEAILDARYDQYNGENCVFVRYKSGALGYENVCWISDSSGLPLAQETYDGDVLIYTMRSSVPDISAPDESVFAIP